MSSTEALRIVAGEAGPALTRDQKRFNTLLQKIGRARAALAAWNEGIARYQQMHARQVAPLAAELRGLRRRWVFALRDLLGRHAWKRGEHRSLVELMCDAAGDLLDADDGDAELKALYDEHAQVDFDTERTLSLQAVKEMTESLTGLDLGDDEGLDSEEDLMRRVHQAAAEAEGAEASAAADPRRTAKRSGRRPDAAQQRREQEAQKVTQSVREVYRKLASALHPDREPDARQREAKTALMQQVNEAYEKSDLLALLELQLRIEQIDAGHMATADPQRVKHYNKVLAEQLEELEAEVAMIEMRFSIDFGLPGGLRPSVKQLDAVLKQQLQAVRLERMRLQNDLIQFADVPRARQWLKVQRRLQREIDAMGYF